MPRRPVSNGKFQTLTVFLGLLLACTATAQVDPPRDCLSKSCVFLDTRLTAHERAADLVSRLTLEEKASLLGNYSPAITRLGVPEYNWWNEGLHGLARAGIATVFPHAIGMAASWDPTLLHETGDAVATEFRANYFTHVRPNGGTDGDRGLTVWSPNINIFRDPRWGRGQETYGEDPFLTGRMGVAYITGLQGNDPYHIKAIATAKHFAVHSGPEDGRHHQFMNPSAHDLEDTYLPAFRAAVTDGNVHSVMCAYNAVNGVPACANANLMQDFLRNAWGFNGYVVSDCGAAANIYREDSLHYTKTPEAGPIATAVKKGMLPVATLDRALERLLEARFHLGLLDAPQSSPFASITAADNDTPAHHATALQMAKESIVLLKNDKHILPLAKNVHSIAVIGPNADSTDALVANYHGTPSHPVTVLDGIHARFPQANILYAEGTGLIGPAEPTVPDSAFCLDAQCQQHGLREERFISHDPVGSPTAQQAVQRPQNQWSGSYTDSSIRWTGYFQAPESGNYHFRYASENGHRIWIGDTKLVDSWNDYDGSSNPTGSVVLQAGKIYPLRIEAFQRGVAGEQRLLWSRPIEDGHEAIDAANSADLVVFVAGLSARLEGEEMWVDAPGFVGGDRTTLELPASQESLLERVTAVGKPVVLVLINGSALGINWAREHVPAIVEAWYPGGDGGTAVASVLAGDYSPAGRLPVTFYQSADQLPAMGDYGMKGRTYRYFDGPVLYPFGYGLSYTTFHYAAPSLSSSTIAAGASIQASVMVTNSGKCDSDEVVQLYLTKPHDAAHPTLAGFRRIHLKAGASQTVALSLDARALSQVDEAGVRKVVAGTYIISFGGGQPAYAETVSAALSVKGETTVSK
jgi:beta-glucosidase